MSVVKEIRAPIETEMKRFSGYFNTIMKSKVPLLGIITNYILRRKGKQLRPMLVFLAAKLSGKINESSFTAAALIELLHTATLVHDDVVDGAVDNTNWSTEGIGFNVRKVGGLTSTLFSGEGLVVDLTGPGRVLLQSRSTDQFLAWLIPQLPTRTDSGN